MRVFAFNEHCHSGEEILSWHELGFWEEDVVSSSNRLDLNIKVGLMVFLDDEVNSTIINFRAIYIQPM